MCVDSEGLWQPGPFDPHAELDIHAHVGHLGAVQQAINTTQPVGLQLT